ncbi:MAG TPA: methylated-DNA--[protein]-cysteine S-methyltransferase [Candidatus Angelobacter sp.]|nr:methylated-DNA--[protein]-cysteine S-methyltransferase [Candidatus Angelobacter sp.]
MVTIPVMYVDEMESPIGTLTISCLEEGLCHLSFGDLAETEMEIKTWAKKHKLPTELKRDTKMTQQIREQLQSYFEGKLTAFDIPLALLGTPFQVKVWEALQCIPYGETRTYKEIAELIGQPKAVRAVGGANNQNPVPVIVPCHRVIGSSGSLVGYGGGLDKKVNLLELEKVKSS